MPFKAHFALFLLSCLFVSTIRAQDYQTQNVWIITLDGLRWQELFAGADPELIADTRYVSDTQSLKDAFWAESPEQRRQLLMPFFWSTLAKEGQLIGNRNLNSQVNLTNDQWFSYPGYNEILTGYADPNITSNAKKYNPNSTILEIANQSPGFEGKVAAFGSWDVFPYIINDQRSGVHVNAGFQPATEETLSERESFLNELQEQTPSPWSSVRLDVFTHHYALEWVKKHQPRLLYIAYGETDDFAHDADYDQYLHAARRTDTFIRQLWEYCQKDPHYANNTTFIITTDHGRGDAIKRQWTDHGTGVKDAYQTWIAAIGPDTPASGERQNSPVYYTNQIARTATTLLGIPYDGKGKAGQAIGDLLNKN